MAWKFQKVAFAGMWIGNDGGLHQAEISRTRWRSGFEWSVYEGDSKMPIRQGIAKTLAEAKTQIREQHDKQNKGGDA